MAMKGDVVKKEDDGKIEVKEVKEEKEETEDDMDVDACTAERSPEMPEGDDRGERLIPDLSRMSDMRADDDSMEAVHEESIDGNTTNNEEESTYETDADRER